MRRLLRVFVGMASISVLASCQGHLAGDVVTIDRASLHLDPGARAESRPRPPALDEAGAREVALPDVWRFNRRIRAREGWYRAEFDLSAPPKTLWAVFAPRVAMNAAFYLNGTLVGEGGRFEEPLARNWNRPLFFEIPSSLLRPGENSLQVRLRTNLAGLGVLYPLRLGPADLLRSNYENLYFLQVTGPQILASLTFVSGVVLLMLYARLREPLANLWFSLGAILWALNGTEFFVRDIPVPTHLWQWFAQTSLAFSLLFFLRAAYVWLDRDRRKIQWFLTLVLASGSALILLGPLDVFARFFGLWAVAMFGLMLWIGVILFWGGVRPQRPEHRWAILPGLGAIALVVNDSLSFVRVGPSIILYPYAMPLGLILLMGALGGRYVRALRESDRLNRELEIRIADKTRELEENHRRLRDVEGERAVGVERERLMREMHDGLGGQLVSTLALVQSGGALPEDVEEGLKDAIEDLRMVIDSLSPMEGDLGALLGTLRSRMERRLAQQGLSFRWEIQDLPLLTWLGPEAAVQVLRIVQEAITNVIKHARAATITVQTGRQANRLGRGGVFVAVTDDGEGFAESSAAGRGLHNMRARASRVGGELIIQPSRRGTLVKLWIPLEPSGV